jgi:hypothetical protein
MVLKVVGRTPALDRTRAPRAAAQRWSGLSGEIRRWLRPPAQLQREHPTSARYRLETGGCVSWAPTRLRTARKHAAVSNRLVETCRPPQPRQRTETDQRAAAPDPGHGAAPRPWLLNTYGRAAAGPSHQSASSERVEPDAVGALAAGLASGGCLPRSHGPYPRFSRLEWRSLVSPRRHDVVVELDERAVTNIVGGQ